MRRRSRPGRPGRDAAGYLIAAVALAAAITFALRALPFAVIEPLPATVASVVAVLLVAALQWWRSNALLSIFTGTTFHVLAVNLLVQ